PLTHESDRYTISIQYLLVIAFFLILRLPPPTTLFPYTTLFRSMLAAKEAAKFTAAVDLFGPLDWYTMLRHSDPQLSQYLRSLLGDRKSTRLNSSHQIISYAVFCLKKKKKAQSKERHTEPL